MKALSALKPSLTLHWLSVAAAAALLCILAQIEAREHAGSYFTEVKVSFGEHEPVRLSVPSNGRRSDASVGELAYHRMEYPATFNWATVEILKEAEIGSESETGSENENGDRNGDRNNVKNGNGYGNDIKDRNENENDDRINSKQYLNDEDDTIIASTGIACFFLPARPLAPDWGVMSDVFSTEKPLMQQNDGMNRLYCYDSTSEREKQYVSGGGGGVDDAFVLFVENERGGRGLVKIGMRARETREMYGLLDITHNDARLEQAYADLCSGVVYAAMITYPSMPMVRGRMDGWFPAAALPVRISESDDDDDSVRAGPADEASAIAPSRDPYPVCKVYWGRSGEVDAFSVGFYLKLDGAGAGRPPDLTRIVCYFVDDEARENVPPV